LLAGQVQGQVQAFCGLKLPTVTYDLSPLTQRDGETPWYGHDENYQYKLNVCGPARTGGNCERNDGMICQYLKNHTASSDPAYIIAKYVGDEPKWEQLDANDPKKGVKATYNTGDNCTIKNVTKPRVAIMRFNCVHEENPNKQFLIHEDQTCVYTIDFNTRYACPPESPLPDKLTKDVPKQGSIKPVNDSATKSWQYFSFDVAETDFEIQLNLVQGTTQGDPDLYVKKGVLPPTKEDYDVRAVKSGQHELLVWNRKSDNKKTLVTGTYIVGVFAFGKKPVDFTITLSKFACPNGCSGHGQCAAQNMCTCDEGYVVPVVKDCSASVTDVKLNTELSFNMQAPAYQSFYRFVLADINAFELQVNVDWKNENTSATVMINKNEYPTFDNNMGRATNRWYGEKNDIQLTLSKDDVTDGEWFISIAKSQGEASIATPFTISVNTYDCLSNCSGHGKCNPTSHSCTCDPEYQGHFRSDCSVRAQDLTTQSSLKATIEKYDTLYLSIDVTADQLNKELVLQTVTKQQNNSYAYPRLYMSHNVLPNRSNHDAASPLPRESVGELIISPHNLKMGKYYVAIPNTRSLPLTVDIKMLFRDNKCPSPSTVDPGASSEGVGTGTVVFLSILFLVIGGGIGYFVAGNRAKKNRMHRILEDGINSDGSYNPPFIDDN